MPCICKMCGCSRARACDEDFCELHLVDAIRKENGSCKLEGDNSATNKTAREEDEGVGATS